VKQGNVRTVALVLLMAALAGAGCCPGHAAPSAAALGTSSPEPSFSVDAAATHADAHSVLLDAASPAPDASGLLLSVAPLLDRRSAARAVRDYRAFHRQLCDSLKRAGSHPEKLLESVGLPDQGDFMTRLCSEPPQADPVASGSFLVPGADEVVLQTQSGAAAAWGEVTLALMRKEGSHYVLVRHFLAAGKFEPHLRVRVQGATDILFLCAGHGNQGLYPAECAVLGQGSFAFGDGVGSDSSSASGNELQTVTILGCGHMAWVELQSVTVSNAGIVATLAVVEADRIAASDDERGDMCTLEKNRRERRFPIRYAVEVSERDASAMTAVRRIDPIPAEVTRVLGRY
jgi:hypothetical protein